MASAITRYSVIATETYGKDPERDLSALYGYRKTVNYVKNGQLINIDRMLTEILLASANPLLRVEIETLPERSQIRFPEGPRGGSVAYFCKTTHQTNYVITPNNMLTEE